MRILLLAHSFNSLTQRLYVELARDRHELAVELDVHDALTCQAVERFRPDIVLAPYLKRPIPPAVWRRNLCLVVHPGPPGDRGPAALDWAILRAERRWGVTVLQATGELDAGPIWASVGFPMRSARKSSLYRDEVTESAAAAVRSAIADVQAGRRPLPQGTTLAPMHAPVRQADRAIDWQRDGTQAVLRKIHSGDGAPGVEDRLLGRVFRLFDAQPESSLAGRPGELLARREETICRATIDGAIWIGQLKPAKEGGFDFKRPATLALGEAGTRLAPGEPGPVDEDAGGSRRDIRYVERGPVGYLHFDFYNGALSTRQCLRLLAAYRQARSRPTRVIVLMGGSEFWCNGMHLHCIEAADSPGDASWENINAIDDLAEQILCTDSQLTIAALQGNAGAGGVFLALACDRVLARSGIVLNPHYRNMGNLFGSEFWTYLLPRRLGEQRARALMESRVPIGTDQALELGLIDAQAGPQRARFAALIEQYAARLAGSADHAALIAVKRERRAHDEAEKPLAAYRAEELERMRLNFYGFDPSYHIARHRFVNGTAHAWTPLYLAPHRRAGFGSPVKPP